MIAVISLEAPSLHLLEQLIENNRMPNLGALQRAGEVIDLESPFLDGSVYATLYTGQHLSEHGIYSLFNWSASEQRLRLSYDLMPFNTLFRRLDVQENESWPLTQLSTRRKNWKMVLS